MRIIIGMCLLLTGCCILKNQVATRTHQGITEAAVAKLDDTSEESTEATEIDILSLLGFSSDDMRTPDPIPVELLPDPGVYNINTRVIIEGQVVEIVHEGQKIEAMWWAREVKNIWRDLRHAEKLFADIPVKFHVSDISFQEYKPNLVERFVHANFTPDILTITYMLPNGFAWDGYSAAPWESVNRGIVVHYLADEWTLAHELGHYFGLLHPFTEDYVDDTPEQEQKYCTGPEFSTSNCHNIMNYCEHKPKHLTPGQVDRFRRFLRAKRMDHYVREYTDVMLRGHTFPTPAGTKVIFHLSLENGKLNADVEEFSSEAETLENP